MDVLTDVLNSLRLKGSVYCRSELENPWTLHFQKHSVAVFHVVELGTAYLRLDGSSEILKLEQGDFVMLPDGAPHSVSSSSKQTKAFEILMNEIDFCRNERWSPSEPDVILLCGTFKLEQNEHHPMLSLLPKILPISSDASWLGIVLQLMLLEVKASRPGMETVIRKLSEVLFIQSVRHWLEFAPEDARGWLGALKDAKIGRALELMHEKPEFAWTVQMLAKRVLMSRAAFSARFTRLVGEPPLSYLTRWRMHIAARLLQQSKTSLLEVANKSGYDSEIAFHRAFKRVTGRTPGSVRKQEFASFS